MASLNLVANLLIWTVLLYALVFGVCGVGAEVDSNVAAAELDRLESVIRQLEARLEESSGIVKVKDETIEKLEKNAGDKSDIVLQLQNEIASIQAKGTSDAEKRAGEAYVEANKLQKEVDQTRKELEAQSKQKDDLKARAYVSENKVQELTMKLKSLHEVSDEQQAKIHKLERALQAAEEEMVRAKVEASSRTMELLEVHGAWLPPWVVEHAIRFQAFIVNEWNEHGKPAMALLTQKTVEAKHQLEKWASPHIETMKTTWAPAIKERWLLTVEYFEPHLQLASTKVAEAFEASKTAVTPHLINVQELVDPYYQEVKKFSRPHVEQIATLAKPHVEKVLVVLKPYTENVVHASKKFLGSATAYHHQVQVAVKEKMENHEFTKHLATKELVWFLASAVMALPVIFLSRICSSKLWRSLKQPSRHGHSHNHARRKGKRSRAEK